MTRKPRQKVNINDLIPDPENPRKDLTPSDPEYKQIARSIETFGFVDPIIFDTESLEVIGGHQRLKVLKEKKVTELLVIDLGGVSWAFPPGQVAPLTSEQRKALNVALNKVTGSWNFPRLQGVIDQIKLAGIDITLTGWTEKELARMLARQNPLTQPLPRSNIEDLTDIQEIPEKDRYYFQGRDRILLMYSGGLDSTYALVWARRNFPELPVTAYYSDTGYELPGVLLNAWKVCQTYNIELRIVKPEGDMMIDFLTKGWPPVHILPCRFTYIFRPITQAILVDHPDPGLVILIDGSSVKQTMRTPGKSTLKRKTKYHKSYLKGLESYDVYHPAYAIDREAMIRTLETGGCPVWPGYHQGFVRTSCWLCPGINADQAGAIWENYPHYTEVVRAMEEITGRKQDYVLNKGIDDKLETYQKRKNRKALGFDPGGEDGE